MNPNPRFSSANLELDDLPDEILLEVLARVPTNTSNSPAKAAAGLRVVSRRWNSIISSRDYVPRFISLGEENNSPWGNGEALLFLFMSRPRATAPMFLMIPSQCDPAAAVQPAALDFSCVFSEPGIQRVIGSSDDLLLFEGLHLVVCNPFTMRWAALPVEPSSAPPSACHTDYVLVCEPKGHRYRVVSIKGRGRLENVFVSETGEWEKVRLTTGNIYDFGSNVLPWKGKLHWYTVRKHIVAYDPFDESFTFFPDPCPKDRFHVRKGLLAVVHGSLRLLKCEERVIEFAPYFCDLFISVWELDCEQERSSLIYESSSVHHLFLSHSHGGRRMTHPPVTLHPYGNVVYFRINHDLMFLDLSEGCSRFYRVSIKDEPEDLEPFRDSFLLTRPWRPTSVDFGSSCLMNRRRHGNRPGILAAVRRKGEGQRGYWKKIDLNKPVA